jgi:hypothetical protein
MNIQVRIECLKTLEDLCLKETYSMLYVSINQQRMYHYKEGNCVKTYVISSSKKPPSCVENSLGTPWGLHKVFAVIGVGQPEGMVFKARKPVGEVYWDCDDAMQSQNLITSRILQLDGLEDGVNRGGSVDTLRRFVYIHGTNHETKLGTPSSSGCLQVSNKDAIELSELIPVGTLLYISRNH